MYVIPAIDVIEGKCVRLQQGLYDQKTVYHEDPLEAARMFVDAGVRRLHLVDLDGAKASKVINWKVLQRIHDHTDLTIDFGGGIKRQTDLDLIFRCGATQATVGSIAAEAPETFYQWLDTYGADKLILGADLKEGRVAVRGWQETSGYHWKEFLAMHLDRGARYVVCTDIARDGMLTGPSVALYQQILDEFPRVELIASGGVSKLDDLKVLRDMGCYGAIVGKAIYEGNISLTELEDFIHAS